MRKGRRFCDLEEFRLGLWARLVAGWRGNRKGIVGAGGVKGEVGGLYF